MGFRNFWENVWLVDATCYILLLHYIYFKIGVGLHPPPHRSLPVALERRRHASCLQHLHCTTYSLHGASDEGEDKETCWGRFSNWNRVSFLHTFDIHLWSGTKNFGFGKFAQIWSWGCPLKNSGLSAWPLQIWGDRLSRTCDQLVAIACLRVGGLDLILQMRFSDD